MALPGCDPADPTFADAAAVDAAADAPATATVTVRVLSRAADGQPDPSATVFFVDPDGTIAATASPDAAGLVTRTLAAGGSVTVGWADRPVDLTTIVGVEDGDELRFGSADVVADQAINVTMPVQAGADVYWVHGPCIQTNARSLPDIDVSFSRPCGPTRALLAESRTTAGRWFIVTPDVTPADGGRVDVTGTWAAAATAALELTGIPIGASRVRVAREVNAGGRRAHRALEINPAITGASVTAALAAPPGFGDTATIEVEYQLASGAGYLDRFYRPALTETQAIDATPTLPSVTVTDEPGGGARWAFAGGGDVDAVLVDFYNDSDESSVWRVIAPPGAATLTRPVLPAPFADITWIRGTLVILDRTTIADYAAFRRDAADLVWDDASGRIVPPGGGRFSLAYVD